MVTQTDHACDCDCSCRVRDRHFRGRKNNRVADCKPGLFEYAARIRGLATNELYKRKSQNGGIRKSVMAKDSGMDNCVDNHCAQRKATLGHLCAGCAAEGLLQFAWAAGSQIIQNRYNDLTIQQL